MREIKFRAWDKKRGEWYGESNPHSLKFYGFHLWGECTLLCPPGAQDLADIEVTQYTGLLDRNGVEIYEGDIVLTEKLVVKVVEWESLTMQPFGQYFEQFDEWEVIGNIYQNPELVPK